MKQFSFSFSLCLGGLGGGFSLLPQGSVKFLELVFWAPIVTKEWMSGGCESDSSSVRGQPDKQTSRMPTSIVSSRSILGCVWLFNIQCFFFMTFNLGSINLGLVKNRTPYSILECLLVNINCSHDSKGM